MRPWLVRPWPHSKTSVCRRLQRLSRRPGALLCARPAARAGLLSAPAEIASYYVSKTCRVERGPPATVGEQRETGLGHASPGGCSGFRCQPAQRLLGGHRVVKAAVPAPCAPALPLSPALRRRQRWRHASGTRAWQQNALLGPPSPPSAAVWIESGSRVRHGDCGSSDSQGRRQNRTGAPAAAIVEVVEAVQDVSVLS